MSDRTLAGRLGCSRQTVTERRRTLRIPPFHPHRQPWSRAEEELLGTMPDRRLARRLKRSVESVATRRAAQGIPIFNPKKHRWTPADDKLLHERPEAQVAMFPHMADASLRSVIEKYRHTAVGWKLSGAGGGGYLILVAGERIPGTMGIKIRRP